jgi:4,5-dihydroxyphthalate decarboxylase
MIGQTSDNASISLYGLRPVSYVNARAELPDVHRAHDPTAMVESLTVALSPGPLTLPLSDPALAAAEGLALDLRFLPATALFAEVVRGAPFDVAELSLANYIMAVAAGDHRWVGLPIFPFRSFRHAMLWVRADSDLRDPAQLRGRRLGINAYSNTALVWLRGMLADEHGLRPQDIEWVRVGTDRVAVAPPAGVRITDEHTGGDLFALLRAGAVDAIAAFWAPGQAAAGARRLYDDVAAVEADYYRRTGLCPIMHLVVLRGDRYRAEPALASRVARLFGAAKQRVADDIARFGAERIALTPWSPLELERAEAVLGADPHPYGLARNRAAVATLARYLHAQGLAPREVAVDALFAPEGDLP